MASPDSLPSAQPVADPVGCIEPRLYTQPLRALTRATTKGYEVEDFARDFLGEPLLPWQSWLVRHALELNPDGTFRYRTIVVLVARQNGKSRLGQAIALWRLYLDGARTVLGVGQDVTLARKVMNECIDVIKSVPELRAELGEVRRVNGDERFTIDGGGQYVIRASNRSAGRGLSVDLLMFDELREQRSWDAWSALSKTTQARPFGQTWCMSNAGDDSSVVLNHLREAALSGRDPSIGLFEWSAEDGCELDDLDAWRQANPALGHLINVASIRSSLGTDPPNVFRTEVLCQKVDALDSAIDTNAWAAGLDKNGGNLGNVRERIVACLDVAPDGEHVSLAAAAALDDGRVRIEMLGGWDSTDDARAELGELLTSVNAQAIAFYPTGPAAALAADLRKFPGVVEIKGSTVSEACQTLAELVTSRRVLHPGDPLLDAHIAAAQKLYQGDGWRFTRRGAGQCDAAYAAAGAVHTALTLPVSKPVGVWVV